MAGCALYAKAASCGAWQHVEDLQLWERLAHRKMWHGREALVCALALAVMQTVVLGAAQGGRLMRGLALANHGHFYCGIAEESLS